MIETLGLPISPAEYLRQRSLLLEKSFLSAAAIPGARSFVEGLAARGVPIAVATSSDRHMFTVKTRNHEWFSNFSVVVCGDDGIARYKPEPDIFLAAAERLGYEPEDCLVFEDSVAGLRAALNARMRVIAFPDPRHDPAQFAGATRLAEDFRELLPSVFSMFQRS